ncbi:hypothetical protein V6S02_13245 [Microbacterium sp. CCNWLW134]|uniref:hypothetical protein n=1 Tax=Microbacterium sp. CCNWLW134 TaxID=3122064 RepID=UPI003010308E
MPTSHGRVNRVTAMCRTHGWSALFAGRTPAYGFSDPQILIRSLQASRGEPQAPRAGASAE